MRRRRHYMTSRSSESLVLIVHLKAGDRFLGAVQPFFALAFTAFWYWLVLLHRIIAYKYIVNCKLIFPAQYLNTHILHIFYFDARPRCYLGPHYRCPRPPQPWPRQHLPPLHSPAHHRPEACTVASPHRERTCRVPRMSKSGARGRCRVTVTESLRSWRISFCQNDWAIILYLQQYHALLHLFQAPSSYETE